MREEKEIVEKNHNCELGLIKREAENKIRVLQSLVSKDPAKKTVRNPSINGENSFFEEKTAEKQEKNEKKALGKTLRKKAGNLKKDEECEEKIEENQTLCEFLKENLNEALEREKKLLEKLETILNKEARKISEKCEEIGSKEIALRPEVERW